MDIEYLGIGVKMQIVIVGGNGYVGKEVTKQRLERDQEARFLLVSRSGSCPIDNPRVAAASTDATDSETLKKVLPAQVDCMVCLAGGMESREQNIAPAETMLSVARELDIPALGYVGGTLGGKVFTQSKADACEMLRASGKRISIVEPTLIYGAGRNDALTKMVPIMKFCGFFAKSIKPVRVEEVASALIDGLV